MIYVSSSVNPSGLLDLLGVDTVSQMKPGQYSSLNQVDSLSPLTIIKEESALVQFFKDGQDHYGYVPFEISQVRTVKFQVWWMTIKRLAFLDLLPLSLGRRPLLRLLRLLREPPGEGV